MIAGTLNAPSGMVMLSQPDSMEKILRQPQQKEKLKSELKQL